MALRALWATIAFKAYSSESRLGYGAILAPGDVIKVDFSSTPGSTGPGSGSLFDWNFLSDSQTISSGSVILSGSAAVVEGVSLSVNGDGSNMDGNTANWTGFGLDPYYIPATDGLIYTSAADLTFSLALMN